MKMTFDELKQLDDLLYKFLCEFEDDLRYQENAIEEGQKALVIALTYSENSDNDAAISALDDNFNGVNYPERMRKGLETLKIPGKACDTARLLLTHLNIEHVQHEIFRAFKI